ncbi:hypothetical protein D3C87_1265090 [compost metagenome]
MDTAAQIIRRLQQIGQAANAPPFSSDKNQIRYVNTAVDQAFPNIQYVEMVLSSFDGGHIGYILSPPHPLQRGRPAPVQLAVSGKRMSQGNRSHRYPTPVILLQIFRQNAARIIRNSENKICDETKIGERRGEGPSQIRIAELRMTDRDQIINIGADTRPGPFGRQEGTQRVAVPPKRPQQYNGVTFTNLNRLRSSFCCA